MNDKTKDLNKALQGLWDSLTDNQRVMAKECKTWDELMLLAGRAGVELPDEMLDSVAGGRVVYAPPSFEQLNSERANPEGFTMWCPKCKSFHWAEDISGPSTVPYLDPSRKVRWVNAPPCGIFAYDEKSNSFYDRAGNHYGGPQLLDSPFKSC